MQLTDFHYRTRTVPYMLFGLLMAKHLLKIDLDEKNPNIPKRIPYGHQHLCEGLQSLRSHTSHVQL